MKQKDVFKLLAAFMILIMIIVPVAYVITSPRSESPDENRGTDSQSDGYNSEFWGVNQPFTSISDALRMTPPGVVTADFVDLESMTPRMMEWARNTGAPIMNEVDTLYNSDTTKMYYSNLFDGNNRSFLLLSTMYPPKNDFNYIVNPDTYFGHYILIRQEDNLRGLINVMGTPVIFGPPDTAVEVLNIITSFNRTNTSYDQFEGLLDKVEPAPFQVIDSNVTFAKQYYMGIREINGSYERTTAYLDINSSTLKKLNQLKANSTEKDIMQYNITASGNYTIVNINSPQLSIVLTEEAY